jgi:flagellum-specific ATP synthase
VTIGALKQRLTDVPVVRVEGRLTEVAGPVLRARLPGARIGGLATVEGRRCEVVGVTDRDAVLLPLDPVEGLQAGAPIALVPGGLGAPVGPDLVGRVLDGLGRPIDGGPPLKGGRVSLHRAPPDPLGRPPIVEQLSTGVRVIDAMLPLGKGQRVAILAGSGVGKSTLLATLARRVQTDVVVLCLVGERGREVSEFLHDTLGPEGLARSVVIAATSDQPAAVQVKAPLLATSIAESFRNEGKSVLLLVDSLTRLALAQRLIGLAAGEPPTTRGFPPSAFAMLPSLLERAGNDAGGGSITALYTVLVEGDDIHDPIGDTVRGIVDGHIVLSRHLASLGHYPAIDVLQSISRVCRRITTPAHDRAAAAVRGLMATWSENEDLVRLGAYRAGSSPEIDKAKDRQPAIRMFLRQDILETTALPVTLQALTAIAS